MQPKTISTWQKALWKFVTNPTVEVVAAIAVVLVAAWVVVQTDVDLRHHQRPFPVPFDQK
ncbi:MAG TPA: hypothetical protein VM122_06975 [Usitatibacter sp.]|nr:hypothetical protein [Usitatibacter sp.]